MDTISLKEFALTGKFGPVHIGMKKQEVINLLGTPDSDQDFGMGYSGLMYGWYEFFFAVETDKLDSIQNDHLKADCTNHDEMILFENEKIIIDPWFLEVSKDFTLSQVKDILTEDSIEFKEEILYDNGPTVLRLSSGVYFDFSDCSNEWDDQNNEWIKIINKNDFPLNGIRYFPDIIIK